MPQVGVDASARAVASSGSLTREPDADTGRHEIAEADQAVRLSEALEGHHTREELRYAREPHALAETQHQAHAKQRPETYRRAHEDRRAGPNHESTRQNPVCAV